MKIKRASIIVSLALAFWAFMVFGIFIPNVEKGILYPMAKQTFELGEVRPEIYLIINSAFTSVKEISMRKMRLKELETQGTVEQAYIEKWERERLTYGIIALTILTMVISWGTWSASSNKPSGIQSKGCSRYEGNIKK